MPSLMLENLPEGLYAQLSERAARHGRTVAEEALDCLDLAVCSHPRSHEDVDRVLADVNRFRGRLSGIYLTESDLQRAKREGRP